MSDEPLARYSVGQAVAAKSVSLRGGETRPPPYFTTATLVDAMRDVDRFVESADDKRILRDSMGIGTARTRDEVVAKLQRSGQCYLGKRERGDKKKLPPLRPSEEAVALVGLLKERRNPLADPVMTAKWEMGLGLIEAGRVKTEQFMAQIRGYVRGAVDDIKSLNIPAGKLGAARAVPSGVSRSAGPRPEKLPGDGDKCPKCGVGSLVTQVVSKEGAAKGKRFLACSAWKSKSCNYKAWE